MATKYDTANIAVFENKVLKEMLEDQLITALDMNQFITADYSLQAAPGMKIEIHTYHGTGDVEDLAMGNGNTGDIGAEYTSADYEVVTTQGRVPFYDEQMMVDPTAIDKAVKHLAEQMTNDVTSKVVAELNKGTHRVYGFDYDFDGVVAAISMLPKEQNEGLFLLISRKDIANFQRNLKNLLSYTEDFVRTGAIGAVAGVPVYPTDAIASGTAFLATKEAVTCFVKKGVETEQERVPNTRKTVIYGRNVKVIALTNDNKVIVLKQGGRFSEKDGNIIDDVTGDIYEPVTPSENDVPSTEGWFEFDEEHDSMNLSDDATVDETKTYYAKAED